MADTGVSIQFILAFPMDTKVRETFIDLRLAVFAFKAWGTVAGVLIYSIYACSIDTRTGEALTDVLPTCTS